MQALLYQFVSRLLSVPLVLQHLEFSLLEPELSFLKLYDGSHLFCDHRKFPSSHLQSFHELCRFTRILTASVKHPILPAELGLQLCTDALILDREHCEPARKASVLTQKDPSSTDTRDCIRPPLSETSSDWILCTSDFTITSAFQKVPEAPIFQPLHLHPPNNLFHLSMAMEAAQGQWIPGLAWSGQKIYLESIQLC